MDKLDLIDLDSLLFLERLLDSKHLVAWFKVEGLLASSESFNKDLKYNTRKDDGAWVRGDQDLRLFLVVYSDRR